MHGDSCSNATFFLFAQSFVLLVLSREWMGMGEWDDYYY